MTSINKGCRTVWSHDGTKIAYTSPQDDDKGDIWFMNRDGTNKTNLSNRPKSYDYFPTWSRDDKFIAFASSPDKKSNEWEIWVMTADGDNLKRLTTNNYSDKYPDWY